LNNIKTNKNGEYQAGPLYDDRSYKVVWQSSFPCWLCWIMITLLQGIKYKLFMIDFCVLYVMTFAVGIQRRVSFQGRYQFTRKFSNDKTFSCDCYCKRWARQFKPFWRSTVA
jgi:hypothetical protein